MPSRIEKPASEGFYLQGMEIFLQRRGHLTIEVDEGMLYDEHEANLVVLCVISNRCLVEEPFRKGVLHDRG